jgi:hypothetical protein
LLNTAWRYRWACDLLQSHQFSDLTHQIDNGWCKHPSEANISVTVPYQYKSSWLLTLHLLLACYRSAFATLPQHFVCPCVLKFHCPHFLLFTGSFEIIHSLGHIILSRNLYNFPDLHIVHPYHNYLISYDCRPEALTSKSCFQIDQLITIKVVGATLEVVVLMSLGV